MVSVYPYLAIYPAEALLRPTVQITPTVNPLFHALLVQLGATPRGTRSYELAAGEGASKREREENLQRLRAVLHVLPGEVCYPQECIAAGEELGFQHLNGKGALVSSSLWRLLRATPAGEELAGHELARLGTTHPDAGPLAGCAVILTAAKGRVFLKVCSARPGGQALRFGADPDLPDLHRLRPGGRQDPLAVTPDRALTLLDGAAAAGYPAPLLDAGLERLRGRLAEAVVAQRVPGAPGQGRLVVGQKVQAKLGAADAALPPRDDTRTVRVALLPAAVAGAAVAAAQQAGAVATLDPQVADVIAMSTATAATAQASPAGLELRAYQREAVGLHLATEVGFLQCCSVGLGKTAMTLSGMRAWAARQRQAET